MKVRHSSKRNRVWLLIVTMWTLSRASDVAVSWSSYFIVDVLGQLATFPPSFPPYYASSESSSNYFSRGPNWCLASAVGVCIGMLTGSRLRVARVPKGFAFAAAAIFVLLSFRSVFFMPPRDLTGLVLAQLPLCLTTAIVTAVSASNRSEPDLKPSPVPHAE